MPTPMPNRFQPLGALTSCLVVALAGCGGKDEVKTLFNEDGAWTLVRFDIGSGSLEDLDDNGRDGFLLSFAKDKHAVTTATCGAAGEDTPSFSLCELDSDAPWTCRCFSYAFEDDQMLWREYPPGSTPPPVELMDDGGAGDAGVTAGGTGSGGGGTGGAGGDTQITVAPVADVASSYTFAPLPDGVFGSDGSTSRFQFEARGSNLFEDRVFGMLDGHPPCPQRCVPQ